MPTGEELEQLLWHTVFEKLAEIQRTLQEIREAKQTEKGGEAD